MAQPGRADHRGRRRKREKTFQRATVEAVASSERSEHRDGQERGPTNRDRNAQAKPQENQRAAFLVQLN